MTPRSKGSFAIARELGVVVVTVRGILDAADCVRLEGTLRDLIDNQGNLAVMVDLQELIGLAPRGLDVFRRAAAWAAVHGGELLVRGPSDGVHRAIEEAGLVARVTATGAPARLPGGPQSECVQPGGMHPRAKANDSNGATAVIAVERRHHRRRPQAATAPGRDP
jgi:anti-anti-sigma regulatory factor